MEWDQGERLYPEKEKARLIALKAITMFTLFQRKKPTPPKADPVMPEKGLLRPEPAASLLATPRRQQLLEHIWQRTSVSQKQFSWLYRAPFERYAELVQQFPASESHHHAYHGGMLDHGLEIVAFALKLRNLPKADIDARVREAAAILELDSLLARKPAQLSGGQRQRVALARALAIEPRVLLLDEPFGALDAQVRRDLRGWLRQLHEQTGLTTVFVTHDQEEALELADRVAILNGGRIEQLATPADAYDLPATPFVYSFVGAVNRLRGRRSGDRIEVAGLALPAAAGSSGDGELDLYVRPEDLRVGEGGWEATVVGSQRSGPRVRLRAQLHGVDEQVELELPVDAAAAHPPGSRVGLLPARYGAFPAA